MDDGWWMMMMMMMMIKINDDDDDGWWWWWWWSPNMTMTHQLCRCAKKTASYQNLGSAYRDEHLWTAWMTIFRILFLLNHDLKWANNAFGWFAPTRNYTMAGFQLLCLFTNMFLGKGRSSPTNGWIIQRNLKENSEWNVFFPHIWFPVSCR